MNDFLRDFAASRELDFALNLFTRSREDAKVVLL
jgi:hypothetical protein